MKKCVALGGRARGAYWGVVAVLGMSVGCTAGKTTIPALTGPSTFGTSVRLLVSPDVLFANGDASATVTVQVSDSNGKPAANRVVYLLTGDADATPATIGQLSAAQVNTGPDGTAKVIYTAPDPQHFSANQYITVLARVADANGASLVSTQSQPPWESARIELISVDQRKWTVGTGTPTCSFITDPLWGPYFATKPIQFQNRSTDSTGYIAEYVWEFSDHPHRYYYTQDVTYTFPEAGDYTVVLSAVDNTGHACSLQRQITVVVDP